MARRERNERERMERDSASSLAAAGSPDAARRVAEAIMHRQGYLLACIHSVVMADLVGRNDEAGAEAFNDDIKPLVDCLLTFSFKETEHDS